MLATGPVASSILNQSRDVLTVVLDHAGSSWPELDEWRRLLPQWFVDRCAPERSEQEAQEWLRRWRDLTPEQRVRAERVEPWSLADWLHWMQPESRQWFWWHALVGSDGTLRVQLEVLGWPAPVGALEWLLRAAGADDVLHGERLAW